MEERFEKFTVLIAKINRSIRKIKKQEMAEYGLSSPHVSCLYYLHAQENLTATDLCVRCDEDKATVSRSLDYLEQNGFLEARPSDAKRYKGPLVLTEKGTVVAQQITAKIDGVLNEVSVCLTESERIDLYRHLSAINDSLEAVAKRLD